MKSAFMTACAVLILAGLTLSAGAQATFNSGSDGSDGPLLLAASTTLDLPADGVFNFTTVEIKPGVVLTFNRNSLNTPVYILATGDITVDGTIDVSGSSGPADALAPGAGGPGGFDGGVPGVFSSLPSAGQGPGGGLGGDSENGNGGASAGAAAYGGRTNQITANDGNTYGSPLLVPLVGGSGGGGTSGDPGRGGGGGGGAILLASNIQVAISGTVKARGGDNEGNPRSAGQGSGGAIRIVAPIVSGTGTLDVKGGHSNTANNNDGGRGRIRIDTIYRSEVKFNFQPYAATAIGSFMASFPSRLPRLDIIRVAGTDIPEGTTEAVSIFMPLGSDATQTIRLQARDFLGVVPLHIQLTPEVGAPLGYDAEIDMASGNPAQVDVDVVIPQNTLTYIHAWTR